MFTIVQGATVAEMRWWQGRTVALLRLLMIWVSTVSAILFRQNDIKLFYLSKQCTFMHSQVCCGSGSVVIGLLESIEDCLPLGLLQIGMVFV